MGCGRTGSVRGTFYSHDETFENVVYCVDCATLLIEYGEFVAASSDRTAEEQVERVRALARRINNKGFIFNGEVMSEMIMRAIDGGQPD